MRTTLAEMRASTTPCWLRSSAAAKNRRPRIPEARELASLLLDRGAEPYDVQMFYNGFGGHASHPLLQTTISSGCWS